MSEKVKYALRFGFLGLSLALAYLIALDTQSILRLAWKGVQILFSIALAEIVWIIFFKGVLGKMEDMTIENAKVFILFRGILYGSIILAVSIGL